MAPLRDKRVKTPFVSSVFYFCFFLLLLIIFGAASALFQVKGISLRHLAEVFATQSNDAVSYTVWHVRVPRVLLAVLLGAGLAAAGALLQGMTRNPLSDPEILGVNQGASCFVVIALVLFGEQNASWLILGAAFLGAAAGGSLIYVLAFRSGYSPYRIVLAGSAVSLFLGALTTGTILLHENKLTEILYWMAGKLSGSNWDDIRIILIPVLVALVCSFALAQRMNVLVLGEETAQGLGMNTLRIRRYLSVLIVVLTGSAVAVAGPIGFIGLMVPHMARRLVGHDYRILLPFSALLGANLLVLADFASQWITYPADIPVGIITALLGTPFFVYLLRSKKGDVK
ncbi:FecCD family ABC transporter permease [Paenibacillus puldeungensis]|uniref:FecCD family ABC transporter permease n=1 Tax=Paenibacillus puldeungensis TaxID=696536 RepID=A0ABW3RZD4_9BACL